VFERYTEQARRAIFFARYEASMFGSPYIEIEHLLLGIFRELSPALRELFPSEKTEQIRKLIEEQSPAREKTDTSVDLPLSAECKRVLDRAAKEAEALEQKYLSIEHMLLGILHEKKSLAAKLLQHNGITEAILKEQAAKPAAGALGHEFRPGAFTRLAAEDEPLSAELSRDLVAQAKAGAFAPLIGRHRELDQLLHELDGQL